MMKSLVPCLVRPWSRRRFRRARRARDRYARAARRWWSAPTFRRPGCMQLGRSPGKAWSATQAAAISAWRQTQPLRGAVRRAQRRPDALQTLRAVAADAPKREMQPQIDPKFLPQQVAYDGLAKSPARSSSIRPRSSSIWCRPTARRAATASASARTASAGPARTRSPARRNGRTGAAGGDDRARARQGPHPAGLSWKAGRTTRSARARMYLGSTLYRIHGTNAPWTIGTNVSSGCIRMRNEDVVDLYERVERRHQGRSSCSIRGAGNGANRGAIGPPRRGQRDRDGRAALSVLGRYRPAARLTAPPASAPP